ncbi:MAG TPA: hypothetical protein VM577_20340 [Anaerovoracaceae bacterium]|nr:hypothetical protein [Anaerovoracaceae bacterium]
MSKRKNDLEISWLGMDGFLVALYFIVVGVIFYAILNHSDFLIGKFIPYGLMLAVTIIFINYLSHVLKFAKPNKSDANPKE